MSIDWKKYKETGMDTEGNWPEKGKELELGESIEGRYIDKKTDVGVNRSNVYVIETSSGKKVGVWGSTVLDSKFSGVTIGSMVAIEYIGDKKGKGSKPYHDYKFGVGIDFVE